MALQMGTVHWQGDNILLEITDLLKSTKDFLVLELGNFFTAQDSLGRNNMQCNCYFLFVPSKNGLWSVS